MKTKCLILLCAIIFIAQKQDCFAQQHAKITVTKEGSNLPKTYVFSEFPQTMYNCAKDQGTGEQRTQITFLQTLKNNSSLSVYINISPSTTGTFTSINGRVQGQVGIDFNDLEGPALGEAPGNGTTCSITITRYPPVGGYITGTFKARALDASDKKKWLL